jgi:hypothetical protein
VISASLELNCARVCLFRARHVTLPGANGRCRKKNATHAETQPYALRGHRRLDCATKAKTRARRNLHDNQAYY